MAGIRWPPDEVEQGQIGRLEGSRQGDTDATTHYSDDERSVAADSWSVKSEYGSTLDGEDQRNADVVDALNASSRLSDYLSDKDEQDAEVEPSMLGLQSHWDSTYADELANFHEHGDAGEIWFGEEVMETMAAWTAKICVAVAAGLPCDSVDGFSMGLRGLVDSSAGGSMSLELTNWNVLDLGTGNGLFLHALLKQGFTNITGTDYSEGAVELSRAVARRSNVDNITFSVDDVLDTKLDGQFKLVTDKGTLDAIGLHPDGPARRVLYWKALRKLLALGGVLGSIHGILTIVGQTKSAIELLPDIILLHKLSLKAGDISEIVDTALVGCSFVGALFLPTVLMELEIRNDKVITSCNSTKDELVTEVNNFNVSMKSNVHDVKDDKDQNGPCSVSTGPTFEYIDHIRTYPTFRFGGVDGSRVSTIAFVLKA